MTHLKWELFTRRLPSQLFTVYGHGDVFNSHHKDNVHPRWPLTLLFHGPWLLHSDHCIFIYSTQFYRKQIVVAVSYYYFLHNLSLQWSHAISGSSYSIHQFRPCCTVAVGGCVHDADNVITKINLPYNNLVQGVNSICKVKVYAGAPLL